MSFRYGPIMSNIGTSAYQLARCFAKLLSALAGSEYTMDSTKSLINIMKNDKICKDYVLVLCDAISLTR